MRESDIKEIEKKYSLENIDTYNLEDLASLSLITDSAFKNIINKFSQEYNINIKLNNSKIPISEYDVNSKTQKLSNLNNDLLKLEFLLEYLKYDFELLKIDIEQNDFFLDTYKFSSNEFNQILNLIKKQELVEKKKKNTSEIKVKQVYI
ncbi:hypothetical protein V2E24_00080 [Mycoplasmopsis ciconiae]|uniref:Uncharacterized protein n=1 Tax=Mycoplasmopsis ciconiae TaxID=561067 RepID=A0ABU7MLQ5_9BACT|nr:hypothetical protein [Mycoplasmopsis ciconiae]